MTSKYVLTSSHVVGEPGERCRVWPLGREAAVATVLWRGKGMDAALVRVDGEPWRDAGTAAVWADLPDSLTHMVCSTLGFPWIVKDGDDRRIHHGGWLVSHITGFETGSYELRFDSNPPRDLPEVDEQRPSPWAGLSGGPVLVSRDGTDYLIGVVRGDKKHYVNSTLSAVRIRALVHDVVLTELAGVHGELPLVPTGEIGGGPARQAPVVPSTLLVNRVAVSWRPDGRPSPVDDASMADLGAWLCLRRGPSTSVVAARPGIDLASALNRVEDGPIRSADVLSRTWHQIDARTAGPGQEADLAALRDGQPGGPDGTGLGLVVGWPADSGAGRARMYREHIRSVAPGTAVVFLVGEALAVDAMASACALGRELNGEANPIEVFTGWWDEDAPTAADLDVPRLEPANSAAGRLMAAVRRAMVRRDLSAPPFPAGDEPLPPDVDAVAVAESVVAELNAVASWGGLEEESVALRLVRDFQPHVFMPLLRRHAAAREENSCWASLSAATSVDRHVDEWLAAMPGVVEPGRVPPLLRGPHLTDAVLLGLIRAGAEPARVAPWAEYAWDRRTPAGRVARFMALPDTDLVQWLAGQDAAVGSAATRAGLALSPGGHVGSAAWWAIVGRSPVTARTVSWLCGLGDEGRQVAGFTDRHADPDPDLAELIEQLRAAMYPPVLMRMERP